MIYEVGADDEQRERKREREWERERTRERKRGTAAGVGAREQLQERGQERERERGAPEERVTNSGAARGARRALRMFVADRTFVMPEEIFATSIREGSFGVSWWDIMVHVHMNIQNMRHDPGIERTKFYTFYSIAKCKNVTALESR